MEFSREDILKIYNIIDKTWYISKYWVEYKDIIDFLLEIDKKWDWNFDENIRNKFNISEFPNIRLSCNFWYKRFVLQDFEVKNLWKIDAYWLDKEYFTDFYQYVIIYNINKFSLQQILDKFWL